MAATGTDKSGAGGSDAAQNRELEAAREEALAAYQNLLEAGEHFKLAARAAGMSIKEEASGQWQKGQDKATSVGQQTTDYVHERPFAALGIAFVAGFLISQVLGRR